MEIIREAKAVLNYPTRAEKLGIAGTFVGGITLGNIAAEIIFDQAVEDLVGLDLVAAAGIMTATGGVGAAAFATTAAIVRRMRSNSAEQSQTS